MFLFGCATLSEPAELTWQGLHAIDTVQTVDIARGGHCQEAGQITSELIGRNPGTAGAIGWGIGMAAVHLGVTHWLEAINAPHWLRTTWSILSIGDTTIAVVHNQGLDDC